MIHRECVVIHKLEDYNQIKKFVKKPYIDKDCIKTLKEKFGTKCKCIEIENPYYESDYLSSYYIFYAKKLQYFPKACYRLLFYADQQKEEFMGYITLRPTYDGRHIGKIYIEPKYLSTNQMSVILGNHKCHIGGSEAVIRIFPHMEQEGDIAVCAHVATWSVLRSFASRFHRYPEILLGEIVEMVSQQSERLIPTRGLTAFQISQIFLDAGFSPVVLSNSSKNSRLIKEAIISYIESGIPMVAVLTNRNHAISVVGLGPQLPSGSNNLRKRIDEIRPFESYFTSAKPTFMLVEGELDSLHSRHPAADGYNITLYKGFSTGQPDLGDSQRSSHLHSGDQFILRHHIVVRPLAHTLLGHTVPAAQITLVRKRYPQVGDIPA